MRYAVVDAFTDRPFAGNPAAVVLLERELDDAARQAIAMEFNLAETAYVRRREDGAWELRWFTPTREVDLCGHATLAAAHALWEWSAAPAGSTIRFATCRSGELRCTREGDAILMDFPATPPELRGAPADAAHALRVLGPVTSIGASGMCLALRLPSAAQVRAARPDPTVIAGWHPVAVAITAPGDEPGVDFVSRFFAPQAGIPEDPVTGSLHCLLAVHYAMELGKTEFSARQLSRRGGTIGVRLRGDRVELRGRAITTMRGELAG